MLAAIRCGEVNASPQLSQRSACQLHDVVLAEQDDVGHTVRPGPLQLWLGNPPLLTPPRAENVINFDGVNRQAHLAVVDRISVGVFGMAACGLRCSGLLRTVLHANGSEMLRQRSLAERVNRQRASLHPQLELCIPKVPNTVSSANDNRRVSLGARPACHLRLPDASSCAHALV